MAGSSYTQFQSRRSSGDSAGASGDIFQTAGDQVMSGLQGMAELQNKRLAAESSLAEAMIESGKEERRARLDYQESILKAAEARRLESVEAAKNLLEFRKLETEQRKMDAEVARQLEEDEINRQQVRVAGQVRDTYGVMAGTKNMVEKAALAESLSSNPDARYYTAAVSDGIFNSIVAASGSTISYDGASVSAAEFARMAKTETDPRKRAVGLAGYYAFGGSLSRAQELFGGDIAALSQTAEALSKRMYPYSKERAEAEGKIIDFAVAYNAKKAHRDYENGLPESEKDKDLVKILDAELAALDAQRGSLKRSAEAQGISGDSFDVFFSTQERGYSAPDPREYEKKLLDLGISAVNSSFNRNNADPAVLGESMKTYSAAVREAAEKLAAAKAAMAAGSDPGEFREKAGEFTKSFITRLKPAAANLGIPLSMDTVDAYFGEGSRDLIATMNEAAEQNQKTGASGENAFVSTGTEVLRAGDAIWPYIDMFETEISTGSATEQDRLAFNGMHRALNQSVLFVVPDENSELGGRVVPVAETADFAKIPKGAKIVTGFDAQKSLMEKAPGKAAVAVGSTLLDIAENVASRPIVGPPSIEQGTYTIPGFSQRAGFLSSPSRPPVSPLRENGPGAVGNLMSRASFRLADKRKYAVALASAASGEQYRIASFLTELSPSAEYSAGVDARDEAMYGKWGYPDIHAAMCISGGGLKRSLDLAYSDSEESIEKIATYLPMSAYSRKKAGELSASRAGVSTSATIDVRDMGLDASAAKTLLDELLLAKKGAESTLSDKINEVLSSQYGGKLSIDDIIVLLRNASGEAVSPVVRAAKKDELAKRREALALSAEVAASAAGLNQAAAAAATSNPAAGLNLPDKKTEKQQGQ